MKKNLSLIINAVLAVAVIVLFILHFSCGTCSVDKKAESKSKNAKVKTEISNSIAYINVDSLLLNYNFAKEANEKLLARSEKSQSQVSKQMNQWQKEAAEFQRKVQSNSFLSRERAEQENARLMKKRQELEALDGKLTKELMDEQKRMNDQLKDTINAFLKEYNVTHKYQVILSNTMNDNILYAQEGCNITSEVVEMLNARFSKPE